MGDFKLPQKLAKEIAAKIASVNGPLCITAETAPPTSSSPLLPDNTLTAYFVTSPTLIATFSGITSPKCALRRQFVGPVCGHTWVPGCITENFT